MEDDCWLSPRIDQYLIIQRGVCRSYEPLLDLWLIVDMPSLSYAGPLLL